jgi:hypothetical protein
MSNDSYDGTVSMNRKLTEEETRELRITLIPYFTTEGGMGVDDITDFLDYTFTMVSNAKAVDYIVKELDGFCSEEVSKKVGKVLADFITKLNGDDIDSNDQDKEEPATDEDGKRVVSLKVRKNIIYFYKFVEARPGINNLTVGFLCYSLRRKKEMR